MNDNFITIRRKKIGQRIALERKKRNWSQAVFGEELSKKMNCSNPIAQNTISNWENGNNLPESLDIFIAMSYIFGCDCGYLLCDYDERTHDSKEICKATGISEESINALCNLKTWGLGGEVTRVIDALIFDYRYTTKGESFAPLVYLLNWFFEYKGNGKIEKQVHISGKIIDCNDPSGYLASTIKLNDRIVENAALMEIEQALISLKKRLAGQENGK